MVPDDPPFQPSLTIGYILINGELKLTRRRKRFPCPLKPLVRLFDKTSYCSWRKVLVENFKAVEVLIGEGRLVG